MNKITFGKSAIILSAAMLLVACGGSSGSSDTTGSILPAPSTSQSSTSNGGQTLWELIDSLPVEPLNDDETAAMMLMREEEKLARDVYLKLYELWGVQIFNNIAASEQTHTDAVLRLLQKYNLVDPADSKPMGEFTDPMLQGLYDMLIALGTPSLMDALIVGATIEDLDIYDLHRLMAGIDNEDITLVFDNLLKGSRNHMRSFSSQLEDMNVVYTPVYITQEEYDAIVSSPMETGQ